MSDLQAEWIFFEKKLIFIVVFSTATLPASDSQRSGRVGRGSNSVEEDQGSNCTTESSNPEDGSNGGNRPTAAGRANGGNKTSTASFPDLDEEEIDEEMSYRERLHGNVRRMSSTVRPCQEKYACASSDPLFNIFRVGPKQVLASLYQENLSREADRGG